MKLQIKSVLLTNIALLVSAVTVLAHPDFDVHPRNLENALGRNNVRQDTLLINNIGDEELTWEMEVQAEVNDWLSANPASGRVDPGGAAWVFVRQDGRDLDAGHYYGNIHFTSNDPTRATYDVPVAGHTTEFPRIEAVWSIPQQGEWWGIDMDRIIQGGMEWGGVYSFQLGIRNRGTAQLNCDTIICNNGYFTISPGDFNLDPGGARNVTITFRASEIGGNSGTITSISSAWNPRELNFRITGTVLPVFRMGRQVPDTVIYEDAAELLIVDLDTVFYASDGGTEITVSPTAGLVTRLARNKELFIHSRPNWFGQGYVALQARLGDSLLVDSFNVQVNPTPDAPEPFDLISPFDADTLYYDGGDSLFVWQGSSDPDMDTVYYRLEVYPSGRQDAPILVADSMLIPMFNLSEIYLNQQLSGVFEWSVIATGGGRVRPAWSTFTFVLTPDRLSVESEFRPPEKLELVSVFPSPFNGRVSVLVNPVMSGICRVELFGSDGRSYGIFLNEYLTSGSHRLDLDLSHLASGTYLMTIQINGNQAVKPLSFIR